MERLNFWLIILGVPIIILAIAIEGRSFPIVFMQATTTVGCIACILAVKELIVLIKSSNEEAKKKFSHKVILYDDKTDKSKSDS